MTRLTSSASPLPQSRHEDGALQAWAQSFLADLDVGVRDELLSDSRVACFGAGEWLCTPIVEDYCISLVHSGLVRAKVGSADGREVTTRYFAAGQFTALPALLLGGAPSSLQAVTYSEVTIFSPTTFRHLLRTRVDLCYRVAENLAGATFEAVDFLEANLFGSVQQRVSRHLLAMAKPSGSGLVAHTDQASLANAIGSVREVVARALRRLSDAGAISRRRRQIWIDDPVLLRSLAG